MAGFAAMVVTVEKGGWAVEVARAGLVFNEIYQWVILTLARSCISSGFRPDRK